MSTVSHIIAKALGQVSADAEFYKFHAQEEAKLGELRAQLDTLKKEADQSQQLLDAIPVIVFSVGQGNEATQVKATAQFQECAAHYQRAGQEKEAFRLLHGLIRQPVQRSSLEANLSLALMTGIESAVNAAFF